MFHARAPRLFSSNIPPSPIELISLKENADHLASEIKRLQAELDAHRGAISLVRSIPLEVLGRIFSFADSWYKDCTSLGLVCRRWREATLLTHELWDTVHIHPKSKFDDAVRWFSRSGILPKTLNVSSNPLDECTKRRCHVHGATVARLLAEGPVLDGVSLSLCDAQCLEWLLSALKKVSGRVHGRPWDMLRSLDLDLSQDCQIWESSANATLFLDLPPVTSLSIVLPNAVHVFDGDADAIAADLNIAPRVLEGLTSLTLTCDWPGQHIFHVLKHCRNLETLDLDIQYLEDDVDDVFQSATISPRLPHMHSMRLLHFSSFEILRHLTTPKLVDLEIGLIGDPYRSDTNEIALKEFARRHGKALQSLRLYNTPIDADELTSIVKLFPNLRRLQLDRVKADYEDFWTGLHSQVPSLQLEKLEVLQVGREDTRSMFKWISQYLQAKGPHPVEVEVSFRDDEYRPVRTPDEAEIGESWLAAAKDDGRVAVVDPEQFGASLKIVPWVDHCDAN